MAQGIGPAQDEIAAVDHSYVGGGGSAFAARNAGEKHFSGRRLFVVFVYGVVSRPAESVGDVGYGISEPQERGGGESRPPLAPVFDPVARMVRLFIGLITLPI